MSRTYCVLGLLVCVAAGAVQSIQSTFAGSGPECFARGAAILRERGPEGLAEAFASGAQMEQRRVSLQETIVRLEQELQSGAEVKSAKPSNLEESLTNARQQLAYLDRQQEWWNTSIDQIGAQRGCSVSRLYWYTDLSRAQAEAERTGRPILSLRMLGKLTDEYSCANSRFFRTALYSNSAISDYLRDNYVLHWQSVRPVPRVTIDFGDGRKLERTLTGNSAHYILSSDGQPLDALPGLYSPHEFSAWLERMREFHGQYTAAPSEARADLLAAYHTDRRNAILRQWDADIEQLGPRQASVVLTRLTSHAGDGETVTDAAVAEVALPAIPAGEAARRAIAKTNVEVPLMRFANFGGERLQKGMDDDLWQAIAALHRQDVRLDATSIGVMRREFPAAAVAGRLSGTKSLVEDPVLRIVRTFEESASLDTVRNEYLLHRQIHELFAAGISTASDVDTLNEWVYAELFLTPSSDPWLGLAPDDVYTALENGGLSDLASQPAL